MRGRCDFRRSIGDEYFCQFEGRRAHHPGGLHAGRAPLAAPEDTSAPFELPRPRGADETAGASGTRSRPIPEGDVARRHGRLSALDAESGMTDFDLPSSERDTRDVSQSDVPWYGEMRQANPAGGYRSVRGLYSTAEEAAECAAETAERWQAERPGAPVERHHCLADTCDLGREMLALFEVDESYDAAQVSLPKAGHARSSWKVSGMTKRQIRRLPPGVTKDWLKFSVVDNSLAVR